ncbi:MAG: hypothetical protein ACO3QC_04695 [Phycisphaerales bacterium]
MHDHSMRNQLRSSGTRASRILALLAAFSAPFLAAVGTAEAQLRVVNYNIAKLAGDGPSLRATLAEMALDNARGFAVAPAILAFQEVRAADLAELDGHVVAAYPGLPYARATFTTSGTEDSASGAQCCYYRTDLLSEVVAGHADIPTGASRNTDRWQFQLVGYSSAAARFYLYSSHLKASNTSADASERAAGATALRNNANALGAGQHIIFLGDYNIYTNTEQAYGIMVAAGNAQCIDPLGSADWVGASGALKHTQSPRDVTGTLVGGGVDDRFDFQLSTLEFHDGDGLSLIANSYRTMGNDGAHYNLAINSGNNSYYSGNITRSNMLADLLFDATDHLPVIADYQVPPVLAATMQSTFAPVIVGATVQIPVNVSNAASVVTPLGVDALSATVTGSNGLVGTQNIAAAALAPAATTVNLTLDTSTARVVNATASISSAVEGTQNPNTSRNIAGTVLAHARPSWSAKGVVTATTLSQSVAAGSAAIELPISLHNFGYGSLQAKLDADGATGLSGAFSVIDAVEANIAGTAATLRFGFNPAGLSPGTYAQTASVLVSDENLPGAAAGSLTVNLSVTVTGGNPADLDGNGIVNGADLTILLSQWGSPGSADLDGNGIVGGGDIAILLNSWG